MGGWNLSKNNGEKIKCQKPQSFQEEKNVCKSCVQALLNIYKRESYLIGTVYV